MRWQIGQKVWFEVPSERFKPRTGSFAIVVKTWIKFGDEPVYQVKCTRKVLGQKNWTVTQSDHMIYRGRPNRKVLK
jgi:hypothetical protein|tara:strand:+ start:225 stop:452 length:228 start_codon:yes stop_codon:yes gene_type:complete